MFLLKGDVTHQHFTQNVSLIYVCNVTFEMINWELRSIENIHDSKNSENLSSNIPHVLAISYQMIKVNLSFLFLVTKCNMLIKKRGNLRTFRNYTIFIVLRNIVQFLNRGFENYFC